MEQLAFAVAQFFLPVNGGRLAYIYSDHEEDEGDIVCKMLLAN